MKTCSRCHTDKPPSDFYADRRTPDGLKAQCKVCHSEGNIRTRDHLKHRISNREHMRQARRDNPDKFRLREKTPRSRDMAKVKARRLLNAAVRAGVIVRPEKCSRCGRPRQVTGHHHDYSQPLSVEWLCYECHAEVEHPLPSSIGARP